MKHWSRTVASLAALTLLLAGFVAPSAGAAAGPNGLIAYSSWDDDLNFDIYVIDPAAPATPPVRLTTDGRNNSDPDWSPDGTRLVFDGWADTGGPRIQVMDVDPATADAEVVSDPCAIAVDCYGDFQPAWSPDGSRIAFVSSRPNADGSDNWSYELYVMDAAGEVGARPPATRLTTDPLPEFGQGINDSQVTWSPSGQRIAFLSSNRSATEDACDLWVMDSHDVDGDGFGDNLQRLTFEDSFNCDAFEDVSPQWSPNSSLIAYTSVRTGYFDIWLVNAADPSDLRNVTQTPNGYEDQPSWSPDGTRIIFRSSVNGAYELFSLPVPGPAAASQRTQLTFDGRTKQQADWGRAATQNGRALTVTRTGRGLVKSSPAGIVCGADCTESYAAGAVVTLTATPWDGAVFTGWAGACTGAAATCRVTMNATRSVTATFTMPAKTFTLTTKRAGMGNGQINSTPAGIACGTDCSQDYAQGTIVRLSARAWAGSSFTGWSGACTGTGTCQLTMNAAKSATATFKRP